VVPVVIASAANPSKAKAYRRDIENITEGEFGIIHHVALTYYYYSINNIINTLSSAMMMMMMMIPSRPHPHPHHRW
jgi:hypothetical protein